jgi:anthranilate/para-aminobenzoate synthase component I
MLVDLARNDVNRVCDPLTTRVDKLMVVQKVCLSSLARKVSVKEIESC